MNYDLLIKSYLNYLKSFKKRITLILREVKKKKQENLDFLNIIEININVFIINIRNKKNKLFFLIISKINNISLFKLRKSRI